MSKFTHVVPYVVLFVGMSIASAAESPATSASLFQPREAVTPYEFIKEVLETHPALMAAHARVDASRTTANGHDRPIYNPEMELRYENDRTNSNLSDMRLELRQTIDWFNKRSANTKYQQANLNQAESRFLATKKHVAVDVLRALVDVLTIGEKVRISKQQLELVETFLSTEKRRLKVGDAGLVAVDLAELALAEVHARFVSADLERRDAEQRLRVASRLQPGIWPQLPTELPLLSEDVLVEPFIDQLPEVQMAQASRTKAERRVRLEDTMRRPDPTLGSEFEYSREDGVTAILTMSIDLPVRNSFNYRVDAARQNETAATFELEDVRVQSAMTADAAARNYRASAKAWRDWQDHTQGRLASGVDRLARQRQVGDISATNYLLQLKQRLDTYLAGVELLQHAWKDWVYWLEATGRWEAWLLDDHARRNGPAR